MRRHQSRTLDIVSKAALRAARLGPVRRALFGGLEAGWRRKLNKANGQLRHPIGVERDRLAMKLAAMHSIDRLIGTSIERGPVDRERAQDIN